MMYEVIGKVLLKGSKVQAFNLEDKVMIDPLYDFCSRCKFCKEKLTNVRVGLEE